ncbi:MAG: polymerase [Clostridiales bacterium]|nr:polymerase [Clostridiales bacterium]
MRKKIMIMDGHSILNRAFYGIPDLTNAEGIHTNAVYGFLNIMFKLLEEEKPDYLAIAFDVKAPTFRHERYPQYKGTRKPMPAELREQVPIMKELLRAMQVLVLEKPGYEADDILGTLAKRAEEQQMEVSLISGDRDLLQLATEHIKIRIPKTKMSGTEIEDYNTEQVLAKYGVTPNQIVDLKGLMGDTSDNIPGVPGIGEKRASQIVAAFGSIEQAKEHIEEVTPKKAKENLLEYYEQALLSKELATIDTDVPLDFTFEDAKMEDFYTEEAFHIVKRMEFKNILSRFDQSFGRNESIEDTFGVIIDKSEWESFQNKMMHPSVDIVGMYLVASETKSLAASFSFACEGSVHTATVFVKDAITEDDLLDSIHGLKASKKQVALFDLKNQLPYLPFDEEDSVYDLGVASYLINPMQDNYSYEEIARDYLALHVPGRGELIGKMSPAEAVEKAADKLSLFLSYYSYVAVNALPVLRERLQEEAAYDLFVTIEMPLVYTLYDMEKRGILVNREALKQYGDQLVDRIEELEKAIYSLANETFNINSPKQLGVILFEKLNLPFAKKTKTGYSTSADVLEKLKDKEPIVAMILEYRQLTKLKSTYADGLANYINENDQRIHGKFNQTIAATGRISSTEPNLQNIPIRMELGRKIRKVFIPKPGYVFLDADYSQIELRVLAHMSGDEKLIAAYKEAQDIHAITASEVFHTPLEEVTSLQRSNAKAVNFGIVYGISSFGLGQDLNISRKEAEGYITKYFDTYPGVKRFLDQLVEDGKQKGYVTTLFHRRRPVPELSSSNFMQRSFGERIAMNSPIQGTAADIIKIAMIRVNERLKKEGLASSLILQVHDELLIETAKDEIDDVTLILQEEMQQAANLLVKLEIEVKQGNNWYEAK